MRALCYWNSLKSLPTDHDNDDDHDNKVVFMLLLLLLSFVGLVLVVFCLLALTFYGHLMYNSTTNMHMEYAVICDSHQTWLLLNSDFVNWTTTATTATHASEALLCSALCTLAALSPDFYHWHWHFEFPLSIDPLGNLPSPVFGLRFWVSASTCGLFMYCMWHVAHLRTKCTSCIKSEAWNEALSSAMAMAMAMAKVEICNSCTKLSLFYFSLFLFILNLLLSNLVTWSSLLFGRWVRFPG